jgi:hypothetical protein
MMDAETRPHCIVVLETVVMVELAITANVMSQQLLPNSDLPYPAKLKVSVKSTRHVKE